MKSLFITCKVILIGLVLFGVSEAIGEDWKFYGRTDHYSCFYGMKSISRPSENIVEVSEKQNYTNEGVKFMVEKLGKKYEKLSHSITLWQIDCGEKKVRCLSLTHYTKDNEKLYSWKMLYSSGPSGEWNILSTGTMGERLYKEICK